METTKWQNNSYSAKDMLICIFLNYDLFIIFMDISLKYALNV